MRNFHGIQDAVLVFLPLSQRGIEGDLATSEIAAVAKSPLTPLYKSGEKNYRAFGA